MEIAVDCEKIRDVAEKRGARELGERVNCNRLKTLLL